MFPSFAGRRYYPQETHALSLNSRNNLANLHNDSSMHQYNAGLFKVRFIMTIHSTKKSFLS